MTTTIDVRLITALVCFLTAGCNADRNSELAPTAAVVPNPAESKSDVTAGPAYAPVPRSANASTPCCLSISADGNHLAIGYSDKTAILWATSTGRKVQTFQGHASTVCSVALSANGQQLATGSADRTAALWDTATGEQLQSFCGHGPFVKLALSVDGKILATGSEDKMAFLWETDTGMKIQTFRGHTAAVACLAISTDSKYLATGAHDHSAMLWETATGKRIQTFRHWGINGVALLGDGKRMVTAAYHEKAAFLWDTVSGKQLQSFMGHIDFVFCVALSTDGKRLATGSVDRSAILWDMASGKRLQTFKGHTAIVLELALSTDGKCLVTTSLDGTTRLWDTATGKELCALLSLDGGKDWLVVTPDGYFDGSEGGMKLMAWREAGTLKVIDDDATRKKFHRPGLLATLWKDEKVKE